MYRARHRTVAEILCFASENSCISINNLYLFYEPRPSFAVPKGTPCGGCLAAKTGLGESCPSKWTEGRGEGGLLCVRNRRSAAVD